MLSLLLFLRPTVSGFDNGYQGVPMSRDTFQAKGIPFDPTTGNVTHEYRVMVHADELLFTTGWYVEAHGRDVYASLCKAYPAGRLVLQKRQIVGDIVSASICER